MTKVESILNNHFATEEKGITYILQAAKQEMNVVEYANELENMLYLLNKNVK
jgi:hypothetical protein